MTFSQNCTPKIYLEL